MGYVENRAADDRMIRNWVLSGIVCVAVVLAGGMAGCPIYHVWERGLAGEAELRQAEWNRQIKIKEAEAHQQSAKALAQAEIERAKGVAEANRIIGEGLRGHEEYLRYLWIMSLEHTAQGDGTVIYVPTEANLPLLEAGRLGRAPLAPK